MIIRSPYGPDGTEDLAYLYIPFGYNIVMQNQRGTGKSEGRHINQPDVKEIGLFGKLHFMMDMIQWNGLLNSPGQMGIYIKWVPLLTASYLFFIIFRHPFIFGYANSSAVFKISMANFLKLSSLLYSLPRGYRI